MFFYRYINALDADSSKFVDNIQRTVLRNPGDLEKVLSSTQNRTSNCKYFLWKKNTQHMNEVHLIIVWFSIDDEVFTNCQGISSHRLLMPSLQHGIKWTWQQYYSKVLLVQEYKGMQCIQTALLKALDFQRLIMKSFPFWTI